MRSLGLLAVAAGVLLGAAVPAGAASRFVIRGAGYGHGVGMSQYGAYGMARQGWTHRAILEHYYTGTAIERLASGRQVRVLLQSNRGAVSFTGATRAGDRRLAPARVYSVVRSGAASVVLRSARGRRLATFPAPLRVTGEAPLTLRGTAGNGVRNGRYRGALEFRPGLFGGINAINAVSLELYLRGVVPAESPPSWPAAALQAQAVAARTYAITTSIAPTAGYDQYPDTRSQVYRGVATERASTNAAIRATQDEVVTYRGKPVVTYFFSTSGGRTENVENSFLGVAPKPWLRSVKDPYDKASPRHRWGPYRMTLRRAGAKLRGLVKGSFRGIDVVKRGVSPRVVYADVIGSRGRTRVTGARLRARLGLFDTWAYFTSVVSDVKPEGAPDRAPRADEQSGGTPPPAGSTARAGRGFERAGVLVGRVAPGRPGAWLRVQALEDGRWTTATWTVLDRGGRYRASLPGPGRYRVVWRGVAGPSVRAR